MSSGSPDNPPGPADQLYRFAFERNPVPMIVTALDDGRILDVNPAFEQWQGHPLNELLGRTLNGKDGLIEALEREQLVAEIATTGAYNDRHLEINLPGKGIRHCVCSAQVFTYNDIATLVTIVNDVTPEHQRQVMLEQNQSQLQILTDLEELLYQETNPARVLNQLVNFLLERMALDRAWLLTPCRADVELLEVPYEATNPEFSGAGSATLPLKLNNDFRQLITRHLNNSEPISYGLNQDFLLPQPMAENSNIQSQLLICLRPATGDPWLLGLHQCSYARDWSSADKELVQRIALRVTDRLNILLLMADLQQSEQRFRQLFESAAEAIVIFEIQTGQLTNFNPATVEMLGYSADELAELTVFDFSPEQQPGGSTQEMFAQLITRATTSRSPRFEWQYQKRDGTKVIAEVKLQQLAGSDHLLRVTAVDITERRHLEEQLMQAQKMESVGELAGGIAHDFNNLLQGILGFSDLLLENPDCNDTQRRQLGHIHEAATRAATLTRQLLAFGRRQVLDKRNIDVAELISQDKESIERVLGSHIELDFILGNNPGTVNSDPVQLQQIMLNLFLNARDAMPAGGVLTIETENVLITGEYCRTHPWANPGRYVMISVSDTGEGMDSDTLEHIFEPFFTTKGSGGSGLGLAMVYGIVKQHNGMIQAYSEPDLGSTFKIYLPQSERPASTIGPKINQAVIGGGETILIAEDDPAIQELVKSILEKVGYQTIAAVDGKQAVDLYRRQPDSIDLVLLDIIMPKMGGKQAYEMIRDINPAARCLFTSGYSNNGVHTGFVLSAGLQLIQKPYTPSDLLRQVRALLDQE